MTARQGRHAHMSTKQTYAALTSLFSYVVIAVPSGGLEKKQWPQTQGAATRLSNRPTYARMPAVLPTARSTICTRRETSVGSTFLGHLEELRGRFAQNGLVVC